MTNSAGRFCSGFGPALSLLLAEQRTWLKFADSFCTGVYGDFDGGGSMCRSIGMEARMGLWTQRIKYLDAMSAA